MKTSMLSSSARQLFSQLRYLSQLYPHIHELMHTSFCTVLLKENSSSIKLPTIRCIDYLEQPGQDF